MNKFFTLLCGTFIYTAAYSQNPNREYISCKEAQAASVKPQMQVSTAGTNYDISYHRLRWFIDPNVRYIKGEITTHFVVTDATAAVVSFDFNSALQLDSVYYRGSRAAAQQIGNELHINLPAALAQGQHDSVTVWYQGVPPETGFGSFVNSSHSTGPIVWTLSEPYGGMDWWPCKMSLDDKIDSSDIYITTPQEYKAGSNGKLISVIQSGSNKTYYWKHRYPITSYLVALSVTNYAEFTLTAPLSQGPLPIVNYVYPQALTSTQNQVPAIIPVIQLYDTLIAPYPFMLEKYGHAQFGWGGGMEHQTMSFMVSFDRDLMAHELAHQWFGNKVTCGTVRDMWLNEGWATYMEGLVYEHLNSAAQWQQWKQNEINAVTSQPGGSVYVSDTTDINRVFSSRLTYSKGSMLLHMLRWIVGDQAFFTATRNYINDPQLAYNYARTSDLKAHLEQASGKDLTEFFNDWFYGQGYPTYRVAWQQNATTNEVTLTLGQTQSHSSVNFFEMPVPVLFRNGTRDTLVVFNHTYANQTFTFNPGFAVNSATLDPDKWLVQRNSVVLSTNQNMLNSVQLYPNPAHNTVLLAFTGADTQNVQVIFSDVLGRTLLNNTITPSVSQVVELDVSTLPIGVYQVSIKVNDQTTTKRLIKH